MIMHLGHQQELAERLERHIYNDVVLRVLAKFRDNQPLSISLTGTAARNEKEISLVCGYQLGHTGKTFAIRSGATLLRQLFCRGSAEALIKRLGIAVFLLCLQHIVQLAAFQFPAEVQKLIHSNVDVDVISLALTCRSIDIIGSEGKMNSSDWD